MSETPNTASFYKVGGALPQDVPSYVKRQSDDDLYAALKAGEFCYVLNSRQMGKTSLMVRTLAKLQAEDWAGIIIDFSAKDSQVSKPDRWYDGIINQLNRQFSLLDRSAFRSWLKERDFIAPVERLAEFIETVLLPSTESPIVIFIDEIDSTLGLPFTDDFFALIRACYNKRAEKPDYQRLTFALLGVAAPSELIGDAKRTPFNIGKSIDLKGFELAEALPLAAGLAGNAEQPETVLREILHWTGGQPFLTQRLCQLVVDFNAGISSGNEAAQVQQLVESRLIKNWESQDHQEHLKTIRKRLLDDEQKAGYLLELYRSIRQAGELPADNQPEERELQLSGLVVKRDNQLRVYNPIYAAVFDEAWINAELQKLRPYSESFRAWVATGKTDSSRLLRGGALVEAEQWAGEKATLSAEDREFLAASRAQQREEEIVAKEREAELAREKQAREAAEEAERIQAEANLQAQRKIRRGNLVLGGALVAALLLGGLALASGNRLRVANRDLEDAQEEKTQVDQALGQARNEVEVKRDELDTAIAAIEQSQQDLQAAKAERQRAETQRQEANDQLKQVQQAAEGQQALLAQLEQDLANADAAVAQAQQAEQDAQRKAEQATEDLETTQQALAAVAQEQQEIAALNDTTKALSGLIDDLYTIDKPEAAQDAIEQIGLSYTDFTGESPELKQTLLNSSIALANLHLNPQDGENQAGTAIDKSMQIIEANSDLFNVSQSGQAIAFFTYAVQGNLLEEQGIDAAAREAYERAFSYSKENNPDLNQTTIEDAIRWFLAGASRSAEQNSERDTFAPLAAATLKKHYDFRAKQLIRELEPALAQHQWRQADGLTNTTLIASAYSKDLSFSYGNIDCDRLREMDTLWSEHSEGRFGFSVQKEIFEATGNTPGQYNQAAWTRFAHEVGWNRIDGNIDEIEGIDGGRVYWLTYDELSWVEAAAEVAPPGHLPSVGRGWVDRVSSLALRTVTCNI